MNKKTRAWCFTSFQVDKHPQEEKDIERLKYYVAQEEKCPETGRLHIQGYVYFDNPVTLAGLKRRLNDDGLHGTVAKGTADQNKRYCTKPDTRTRGPWEYGEPPRHGGRKKRSKTDRFASAIARGARIEEMALHDPGTFVRNNNGFRALAQMVPAKRREGFRLFYVHGDTGVGKTTRINASIAALQHEFGTPVARIDVANNFLNGYTGEPVAFYDEFHPNQLSIQLANKLADRSPATINVKGGAANWNVDTLIIASNILPDQCYWGEGNYETFQRRLNMGTKIELLEYQEGPIPELDLTTGREKTRTLEEILMEDEETEVDEEPEEKKE